MNPHDVLASSNSETRAPESVRQSKVCQLSKCDGSPSNVAIMLGGPNRGSILHRQDGPKNCCPVLLKYIWLGEGRSPTFPHAQHPLDYDFLARTDEPSAKPTTEGSAKL